MVIPHIAIKRHDTGIYEWLVLYGPNEMDGEAGEESISDCLVSGIGSIPEDEKLVEISYRGIHMGTFHATQVKECPEDLSQRIVEMYSALMN